MNISTLDQLILDVARHEVPRPARVAIIDDPHGALLRSVLSWDGVDAVLVGSRTIDQARAARQIADQAGADNVRVAGVDGPLRLGDFFAETLAGERAGANAGNPAGSELGETASSELGEPADSAPGIDLALGHTPKSLEEVAYLAAAVAGAAASRTPSGETTGASEPDQSAVLVLGANNKHMDRGHNATLAEYFSDVRASRGRGKFRALVAGGKPTGRTYAPAVGNADAGPIFGVGGVFSGATEDHGGRLLVDAALPELEAAVRDHRAASNPWDSWERPEDSALGNSGLSAFNVVDLGCGNGSVALAVLDALPAAHVLATDSHADAVVSASLTLREFVDAGRARVTWDDAAGQEPEASAHAVLLNPPFHAGNAIDATLVHGLLDAARRLLAPGGLLFMVHNNHLRYRPEVEARFANVEQVARNPKFTVLRAQA
ncbi:class I SAM-dependent methyltransferase [Trueperella bialowiezensis]|uniref:Ribosomal RNA large subunit methyltransferase G n=1 Tax=Trueperella bialowiezensis TaxID=312285 RepID=A0A448PDR3_9ACTO|nr:methyltransferase [Trueperella bialowiezensis]VEI13054.1 Ribosomal RNA large subunit methyltransferase G [Trueperella bialowiezensis]